ncbi:MAG: ABC transporter ATP-binding protein [Dehalococcoidales bacterium]|jgi:ABC-2 type transport system ATP-binding protein
MTGEVVIETKDLTKRYDGTTVVDRLNLAISENQAFGLLGPNGAGKTTTILMLLGLTESTSGSARIGGFNPAREPLKVKRLVGYMPEKLGFYDNLTARENLDLIAQFNGISAGESLRRSDELLEKVGIVRAADMAVGKFSKGMKQRLGIADVLIKKPRVVIFDEPTTGLDPEGINQVLDIIAGLPGQGTTVMMSSHRLYEVQRVCQRVGILSGGKLVVEGSLDELSKKAQGESRYRIEVETGESAIGLVDIIKGISGVSSVSVEDKRLLVNTDTDLRSEIAKTVVANNVPLVEIKIHELTLDEIYMKYFRESEAGR